MDVAMIEFIDPREPIAVIPILRAGLALAEHASSILPATKTYHLGGTIVAALNLIKKCGVENSQIKVDALNNYNIYDHKKIVPKIVHGSRTLKSPTGRA